MTKYINKFSTFFLMPEKIYLDTNIYLDYFENRHDNIRPLGFFAYNLIRRCIEGKFKIVISDWVVEEFGKVGNQCKIDDLIKTLKKQDSIIIVKTNSQDLLKSKEYKNWTDALHIILAIKAGADYFVTRNTKDFLNFQNSINIVLPENI